MIPVSVDKTSPAEISRFLQISTLGHDQTGAELIVLGRFRAVNGQAALLAVSPPKHPNSVSSKIAEDVLSHNLCSCSAPGSLDTSLSHAAGLIEIAACDA